MSDTPKIPGRIVAEGGISPQEWRRRRQESIEQKRQAEREESERKATGRGRRDVPPGKI
jgi:hypothetical protein